MEERISDDLKIEDRINEDLICVLKKNTAKNEIEIGYVDIVNPFTDCISSLTNLCDNAYTSLNKLANEIARTKELRLINAQYSYCETLHRPFQGFAANTEVLVKQIHEKEKELKKKEKDENRPNNFNFEEEVESFKNSIKSKLILWGKATSINKSYRRCHEDKSILTFSHRLCGWSNPVYQLTPNFSVEVKTNFGFGSSSYFYTKLKYKEIEITPFSEWIDYEYANFSEINRYTKSHNLQNKYWHEAMIFCREACNLSMSDENQFVKRYILDECEEMVSGLEDLFHREQFTFKQKKQKDKYTVDKKGHVLIEFRGEKISGALDFVSKIIEFERITEVKYFISRIENCNKRIKPILIEESELLNVKLGNLNSEMALLKPIYQKAYDKNQYYLKQKGELRKQIIQEQKIKYNEVKSEELEGKFNSKFPEYAEFFKKFSAVSDEYSKLTQKINITKSLLNKILAHNEKIKNYFENRK